MLSQCMDDDGPFPDSIIYLPQSIDEGNWGPEKYVSKHQRCNLHFQRYLLLATLTTSHWVSPWHLGQDHHHGDALSQSLWKVSQSCLQPTKHPWQHSQLTVTRKQKCSNEWPNAHVPRYRSHFWPCRCNSLIVVVFLPSFKSHNHCYGCCLYHGQLQIPRNLKRFSNLSDEVNKA